MARALEPLGIKLWDGTLDLPGRLAFMGGPDGTLILAAAGRGWMPTGRAAIRSIVSSSARVRASVAQASIAVTDRCPMMKPVLLIHQLPSSWMYP